VRLLVRLNRPVVDVIEIIQPKIDYCVKLIGNNVQKECATENSGDWGDVVARSVEKNEFPRHFTPAE